jgi:hypothetical protein
MAPGTGDGVATWPIEVILNLAEEAWLTSSLCLAPLSEILYCQQHVLHVLQWVGHVVDVRKSFLRRDLMWCFDVLS